MRYTLIAMFIGLSLLGKAQETFNRMYGSDGMDWGQAIVPLANGEFMVAGASGGFGLSQDAYLLHLAADGDIITSNAFGGPNVDVLSDIAMLSDGSFFVIGTSNSFGDDYDVYWAVVNAAGTVSQEGAIDSGDWDFGKRLVVADTGEIYLLCETYNGNTDRDLAVYQFSSSYAQNWSVQIESAGDDFVGDGLVNTNGNLVIGASRDDGEFTDPWVVVFNAAGDLVADWVYPYQGMQTIHGIIQANNGKYIALGTDESDDSELGQQDMLLMRFTQGGTEEWHSYWGGEGSDYGVALIELSDNDIVIAGYTNSFGNGLPDAFNFKTYRLSPTGQYQSGQNLTVGGNGDEILNGIEFCPDEGYVMVGTSTLENTNEYVHVVKADADNQVISEPTIVGDPNNVEVTALDMHCDVYPLPARDRLHIETPQHFLGCTLALVDAQGRQTARAECLGSKTTVFTGMLRAGTYFLVCPDCAPSFKPLRVVVVP